jgi:hypothetical protein
LVGHVLVQRKAVRSFSEHSVDVLLVALLRSLLAQVVVARTLVEFHTELHFGGVLAYFVAFTFAFI